MPTGHLGGQRGPEEERRRLSEHVSHEALLDALLPARDAFYVKDRGGRYLLVNSIGAASLGYVPEDLVGKTDRTLLSGSFLVGGGALYETEGHRFESCRARSL